MKNYEYLQKGIVEYCFNRDMKYTVYINMDTRIIEYYSFSIKKKYGYEKVY